MGGHAEGHHQAKEHPRGQARAAVQLRGLHDALHVCLPLPSLLLLLAAVAFTAATARVSQLDPLRSGSDLGFWFPYRRTIYNMCTQKPPHDYSQ